MQLTFFTMASLAATLASAQVVSIQTVPNPTTYSTLSTVPYSNAFTTFLTQTNSLGVVTGQPSVITSQPAVVTSQPAAALVPAGFTGVTTATYGNLTRTISANSESTVLVTSTPTPSSTATGTAATGTRSATGSTSTSSSAAAAHFKAGVGALALAGGVFAAFL